MIYRFCERCERVTYDGNLWCQDPECPAEEGYELLEYGDYFADLKVTKLVRVWRTAALYEAERGAEQVLLKVAHPTDACIERLRREADALQALSPERPGLGGVIRSFLPIARPKYLVPLAPFPGRFKRPYGEITFRGEPRVFCVFRYVRGKILSDLLLETPQIWHTHAAWMISTIARALRPLIRSNRSHLNLIPDIILVDTDKQGILRPTLLDLGFIADGTESGDGYNWLKLCEPAYTAPELLTDSGQAIPTLASDVYSLGMIFYEMLAGHPGYEGKMRRDGQLRDDVLQKRQPLSLGRPELEASGVAGIVDRAVSPTNRYANALEFASALTKIYSAPPSESRKVPRRLILLLVLGGVILLGIGIFAGLTLLQVLAAG